MQCFLVVMTMRDECLVVKFGYSYTTMTCIITMIIMVIISWSARRRQVFSADPAYKIFSCTSSFNTVTVWFDVLSKVKWTRVEWQYLQSFFFSFLPFGCSIKRDYGSFLFDSIKDVIMIVHKMILGGCEFKYTWSINDWISTCTEFT